MLDVAIKVLEKITNKGYSAYIVGGFVRDYVLGIESSDVDICTNAKPKELLEIFDNAKIPKEDYGSVIVYVKDIRFEITTFRREIKYLDNRKPVEIQYVNSVELDVLRRDFTINTLCMDKDKNILDLIDGLSDIDARLVKCVGNSDKKLEEDALRILRAVRFATKLRFRLDENVVSAIKKHKHLLKNISYERKKEELDKIFTSNNIQYGISLLLDLGLDRDLEIPKLKDVKYTDSLMGIWTILSVDDIYKFSNNEKDVMASIRKALDVDNLDPYNLYNLGLYANSIAGGIKGTSNKEITLAYNNLVIENRDDIDVSATEIAKVLEKEPGRFLNEIFNDLEKEILYKRLNNKKNEILNYCIDNYK